MGGLLKAGLSMLARGVKSFTSGQGRKAARFGANSLGALNNTLTKDLESSEQNQASSKQFSIGSFTADLVRIFPALKPLLTLLAGSLSTQIAVLLVASLVIITIVGLYNAINNPMSLVSSPSFFKSDTLGVSSDSSETSLPAEIIPFIE